MNTPSWTQVLRDLVSRIASGFVPKAIQRRYPGLPNPKNPSYRELDK